MLSLRKEPRKITINLTHKEPLRILNKTQMFCSPVEHVQILSKKLLRLLKLFSGKASLCVSPDNRGSMTVEAAIVLPFFMLVLLSVLSFMEIIRLQNGITMGLREAGMPMSVYGYAYERMKESSDVDLSGIVPNMVLSYGYAGKKVEDFLGKEYLERAPLPYGAGSLQYYRSSIMEKDDRIDLVALYAAELDFNVIHLPKLRLCSRYYGRAWTGYDLEGSAKEHPSEINVYVTPKGSVYHMSRYCTHLQLTILSCPAAQVGEKRNEGGSKYRPCALCGSSLQTGKVYITTDGDCYHSSIRCPGLKRTIEVIPLSKVGGRSRCSRCGG